ncbi:hypothetical protein HPB52_021711 [Rhipicephalus sanguineus]|uniref:Uncharacterized protein n=1 Tax=Rhipicephalus sanguineus TaxID=34632 RepID=A0A9D4Q9E5_RHISA|nr:hypothetical protein HPB52_021711 [Rhipicephalus sanguineus]
MQYAYAWKVTPGSFLIARERHPGTLQEGIAAPFDTITCFVLRLVCQLTAPRRPDALQARRDSLLAANDACVSELRRYDVWRRVWRGLRVNCLRTTMSRDRKDDRKLLEHGPNEDVPTHNKQQGDTSGENKDKNEGAAEPAARKKEATEGDKATAKKNVPEETARPVRTDQIGPHRHGVRASGRKRPLEVDEGNDNGAASACEPLLKAPFVRRPTLRIQPKVPPDRRSAPSTEKRHRQQNHHSGENTWASPEKARPLQEERQETEDKQQVTPSGENKDKNEGAAEPAARKKEATEGDKATAKKNVPEETSQTSADGPDKDPTDMEYAQVVVKRPLEVDEGNDNGASSACEPLPKAPFVRRPTLRIQPKVPPDRRSAPSTEKKAPPAEPP